MKSTKTPDLQDVTVLVTRPAHQAEPLCRLIEQHNGACLRFPVIEIADIENNQTLLSQIERLDSFDIAIFISPNAVHKAVTLIQSIRKWPNKIKIAAVGNSSAKALDSLGLIVDIFPSLQFNSEALLELEPMQQVQGKHVIIFRGEGGREHLANTLKSRGASVEYAECYRRQKPQLDSVNISSQLNRGDVSIIVCTSNEGLHNLHEMVGPSGQQSLLQTPLIVVSERAADLAQEMGFTSRPLVSSQANDDAILNSIILWRKMKNA